MTTINTKDLTGPALDWAVAASDQELTVGIYSGKVFFIEDDSGQPREFTPSTNPAQGHPIIEREGISNFFTDHTGDHAWFACVGYPAKLVRQYHGPTMLIAAMRCHVAARLGPTVDVPQELMP